MILPSFDHDGRVGDRRRAGAVHQSAVRDQSIPWAVFMVAASSSILTPHAAPPYAAYTCKIDPAQDRVQSGTRLNLTLSPESSRWSYSPEVTLDWRSRCNAMLESSLRRQECSSMHFWHASLVLVHAFSRLQPLASLPHSTPQPRQRARSPSRAAKRLFARDNLIAWCIVPFDSKKRSPEDRAAMLHKLGFKHFAYDWRAEHIPTFDAEVDALKQHGIALDAFWVAPGELNRESRIILDLLKRHGMKAQLWVLLDFGADQCHGCRARAPGRGGRGKAAPARR